MSGFEQVLGTVNLIVLMFLVLAAAVEALLEMLRGALEGFGLRFPKSEIKLEDAIALAVQVAPKQQMIQFGAIKQTVGEMKLIAADKQKQLDDIVKTAERLFGDKEVEKAELALGELTMKAKRFVEERERHRVYILRTIAVGIGFALSLLTDMNLAQIVENDEALRKLLAPGGGPVEFGALGHGIGALVTGIAASSGSSYWHDKVDKVRSLKALSAQAATLSRR